MSLVSGILVVYYLVFVLLFEEKSHHFGPYPSRTLRVERTFKLSDGTIHTYTQPVTLFDRVRRVFGAYNCIEGTWFVNEGRMEMWMCPTCLSFWVSLVVTPLILLTFSCPLNYFPVYVFALAGGSRMAYFFQPLEDLDDTD